MPDTGKVITQLTGSIDFAKILGMPLAAVVDAAHNNAKLYAEFIKSCLDENGNPITVTFTRKESSEDGKELYRVIEMPLLAIVEHPSLSIDEFSNTFTLEISDSYTQDIKASLDGNAEVGLGWGPFKVSVDVKFSASYSQTRKTDTRAKQEIIVKAHQVGASEGMMKVIEFLTNDLGKSPATNVAPPKNPSLPNKPDKAA